MEKIELVAEPLTKAAFQFYGNVIEAKGAKHFTINKGTVNRYHDLANIDIDYEQGGRPVVSMVSIKTGQTTPVQVKIIERHPKASQAFIPMFQAPVYIVVGTPSKQADVEKLKAFVTNGQQGFNYHAGVWHMPLMGDKVGRQFIVIDREGPEGNCDEYEISNYFVELR